MVTDSFRCAQLPSSGVVWNSKVFDPHVNITCWRRRRRRASLASNVIIRTAQQVHRFVPCQLLYLL
jgi:hypothetical protein